MQVGYGMSSSPLPMGRLVNQPSSLSPPPQPYNGPRGPFAPVPANQGLLQPLIPTQTVFNGFIPTNPANSTPFQNQLSPPSFLPSHTTGFSNSQLPLSQPTGIFNNFSGVPPFQGNSGFAPVQSHTTGFNAPLGPSPFANPNGMASPPPLPSNPSNNTSPANVFAQMKSGAFANENDSSGLGSNLGPNNQATGWGQSYQGYTGY